MAFRSAELKAAWEELKEMGHYVPPSAAAQMFRLGTLLDLVESVRREWVRREQRSIEIHHLEETAATYEVYSEYNRRRAEELRRLEEEARKRGDIHEATTRAYEATWAEERSLKQRAWAEAARRRAEELRKEEEEEEEEEERMNAVPTGEEIWRQKRLERLFRLMR